MFILGDPIRFGRSSPPPSSLSNPRLDWLFLAAKNLPSGGKLSGLLAWSGKLVGSGESWGPDGGDTVLLKPEALISGVTRVWSLDHIPLLAFFNQKY